MKAAKAMKATVMLIKNKRGKLVSKKRSAHSKKHPWIAAVMAARLALNIEGFCPVRKSSAVYKKAKSAYTTYKKAKQLWIFLSGSHSSNVARIGLGITIQTMVFQFGD